jgi:hypothetical protein
VTGHTQILICSSCDYKRYLTEAESRISYALVVACLKCGTAMQCNAKKIANPPETQQTFLKSCTLEALEDWVVS